ncbi:MAG: hypothetical protein DI546_13780 [Rhizobium sp.]|nr:MAG: hypothetical protein DI546_13780 [Rhizobium sp.]
MNIDVLRKIERELDDRATHDAVGSAGLTALAMIVSGLPLIGGPGSIALDLVKKKLFEPDFRKLLIDLNAALIAVTPHFDKIVSLEEKVACMQDAIAKSSSVSRKMEKAIEAIDVYSLDSWVARNTGGQQTLKNLVLRNLDVLVSTSGGGITVTESVSVNGPARFEVGSEGSQIIADSQFEGRSKGSHTSSRLGNVAVGRNTTVEFGPQDGSVGLRVTTVVGGKSKVGAVTAPPTEKGEESE